MIVKDLEKKCKRYIKIKLKSLCGFVAYRCLLIFIIQLRRMIDIRNASVGKNDIVRLKAF
jgi:hypothetical protein